MEKAYSKPEMKCTPMNSKELMQTVLFSEGGGGYDQTHYYVPSRPNEYHENNN